MALNKNVEAFVVHVFFLNLESMIIYPAQKAQITLLITEIVTIPAQYLNYINIFSKKLAIKLFWHYHINKHIINLEPKKQPPYRLIYNLRIIKLKIF